MKKILLNMSVLIFPLGLLFSCLSGAIPKTQPRDNSSEKITIDFAVNRIEFIDNRSDTTSKGFNLPKFSTKSQVYKSNPSLNMNAEKYLDTQIRQYFSGKENKTLNVTIFIQEGERRIEANAMKVSEHVKIKIKIELLNISNGDKYVGTSTISYDMPMMNATEEHLNQMYGIALKNAIHDSFSNVGNIKY